VAELIEMLLEIWTQDSDGAKENHVSDGGPDPSRGRDNFFGGVRGYLTASGVLLKMEVKGHGEGSEGTLLIYDH